MATSHPNIMGFVGKELNLDEDDFRSRYKVYSSYWHIEQLKNVELFDLIVNAGPFSETIAKPLFKQLLSVLMYLHELGIYHGDIKPDNIGVGQDFKLKLLDFGFA